jgi:hypothetical protein
LKPALFCEGFFQDKVSRTAWAGFKPLSSQVARITGMNHW